MTFYVLLWGFFYLMGMYYLFAKKKVPIGLAVFAVIIVAFFVGFRVNVGADWENYVELYYGNVSSDGRDASGFEPLFRLFRNMFFGLGISYQGFFFFLSLFSLLAIIRTAKVLGVNNYFLVLLVYISLCFCSFQLNVIRIGIMCSCLWIGLSYRKESLLKAIVWLIIGSGFHYLGLVFFPLLFIVDKTLSMKWYLLIIVISFIALILNIGVKIVDSIPFLATLGRVSDYLDPDSTFRHGNGITIGFVFNVLFCSYLRIRYKKQYEEDVNMRILLNLILYAIIFASWFNGLGIIAQRGGQSMNVALCFVWVMFFTTMRKQEKTIWFLLFTAYLLLFYMRNFTSEGAEDRMFIPYKVEMASFFR